MEEPPSDIRTEIGACRLCAERFAATETAHSPRPVVWFSPGARILIAGQAPGLRVHEIGEPFRDPSGNRLRDWLGMDEATFYDRSRVAIVPMAFCFPGYNAAGSDLAPPKICAKDMAQSSVGNPDRSSPDLADRRLCAEMASWYSGWCDRNRCRVARPCARCVSLASSVVAQYRMAQEKPVVRGRAAAGAAGQGQRGAR